MIDFQFNTDEEILHIDFSGKITKDDIEDLYKRILSMEFPTTLFIFQNEVNADFIDSDNLIPIAVNFYTKMSSKHERIEIAVWQTEPIKTAYSFLFKNNFDIDNIKIKIFYTKKAALDWLKKI